MKSLMKPKCQKDEAQPEQLDAATIEAIKLGLASEQEGNFVSLDKAVELAKQRRKKWMKSSQSA